MEIVIDLQAARKALYQGMLDQDLGIKEAASRIDRSSGTVKRALRGSMGPRTAYKILKVFGDPEPDPRPASAPLVPIA